MAVSRYLVMGVLSVVGRASPSRVDVRAIPCGERKTEIGNEAGDRLRRIISSIHIFLLKASWRRGTGHVRMRHRNRNGKSS